VAIAIPAHTLKVDEGEKILTAVEIYIGAFWAMTTPFHFYI
jgi:hypothetical protein